MSGTSCPTSIELRDAAQRGAPLSRRDPLRGHVDRCPVCRERFDGLVRVVAARNDQRRRDGHARSPGRSTWHPVRVAPPVQLGQLHLHRVLGRGDQAVTFEGNDGALKRAVSARFLLTSDPDLLDGLLRTIELTDLHLPGLNPLQYVDIIDEYPLIVSDLCPGVTLAELPAGPGLPGDSRPQLILAIADLLAPLHAAGHVHGRLGPTNVCIDAGGSVRLCNYGLPATPLPVSTGDAPGFARLAPPEATERIATPAGDVYALAGLAYELWTGRPPFTGRFAEVRAAHEDRPVPLEPLTQAGLPEPLVDVLRAALAKDPRERPGDAASFAAAWRVAADASGIDLNGESDGRVPELATTVTQVRPAERPVPRAKKVRRTDVPELLSLLTRRHGWGDRIDPDRNHDWLDRVYPELQRLPDSERSGVLTELLDDDKSAESVAAAGVLLAPVVAVPVVNLLRGIVPPFWWTLLLIALVIAAAYLLSGLARIGYALLTHRAIRMKLRRRLLAAGVPICMRCGYDLRGNRGALCPECGYLAPLIQYRVLVRGEDEHGAYDQVAFTNSLTPANAGSVVYDTLRSAGQRVLDIRNVRQEPGWSADWPVGVLRVGEKEYVTREQGTDGS